MKLFDLVQVKLFNQNHCSFQHWLFQISSQDICFYVTCHKSDVVKSKMTQAHSDEVQKQGFVRHSGSPV